ncbi:glycine-rich domain-containing protein [Achromobacter animicus]|uniref:glycine-rich domain-containing protein n=1 Tax=Achromobacter animicus TaxID=1389935 RepID=UPI00406BC759
MDYPKSVPGVGLVNGKFVNEDPIAGRAGSLIPAEWGCAVTDELLAVIGAAELELSEADNGQVIKAINILIDRAANVPGRLLRTSVYRNFSGTQQVSVDGGAFSATGGTTFSSLPATSKVRVRIVSGGGGGGGTEGNGTGARSTGGGGGGGGHAASILDAPLSAIPVTVGAGGAGGSATGAGQGGTGGTSSFGALLTATGGAGGAKGLTTTGFPLIIFGGTGGFGSLGNLLTGRGGNGGDGYTLSAAIGVSGEGGFSSIGQGGGKTGITTGDTASTPGGGGGGAAAAPSSGGFNGGAGAAGVVIVEEYS